MTHDPEPPTRRSLPAPTPCGAPCGGSGHKPSRHLAAVSRLPVGGLPSLTVRPRGPERTWGRPAGAAHQTPTEKALAPGSRSDARAETELRETGYRMYEPKHRRPGPVNTTPTSYVGRHWDWTTRPDQPS